MIIEDQLEPVLTEEEQKAIFAMWGKGGSRISSSVVFCQIIILLLVVDLYQMILKFIE